jgi:hypothetical protein
VLLGRRVAVVAVVGRRWAANSAAQLAPIVPLPIMAMVLMLSAIVPVRLARMLVSGV